MRQGWTLFIQHNGSHTTQIRSKYNYRQRQRMALENGPSTHRQNIGTTKNGQWNQNTWNKNHEL
jgi:hypothetical protein